MMKHGYRLQMNMPEGCSKRLYTHSHKRTPLFRLLTWCTCSSVSPKHRLQYRKNIVFGFPASLLPPVNLRSLLCSYQKSLCAKSGEPRILLVTKQSEPERRLFPDMREHVLKNANFQMMMKMMMKRTLRVGLVMQFLEISDVLELICSIHRLYAPT